MREVIVATFFGLIHGAVFPSTLSQLQLRTPQLLLSVFDLNLGIEVMQLAIVAVALPSLTVLVTTRGYTPLRLVSAVVAVVAALGWLAERVGTPNAVATQAERPWCGSP